MTRRLSIVLALAGIAVLLVGAVAEGHPRSRGKLASVRRATVQYHSVANAEADGYEKFLECFDSEAGGMGQHYVDMAALDDVVDRNHPEAMVYEVTKRGLRLVAVEYIVPAGAWTEPKPPKLFGRHFHMNEELDVWILHAWIWKWNPLGVFEDYNPRVRACPSAAS